MTSDVVAPAVRRLGDADAAAILEIAQVCDIAEIGEADTELEDVQRDLHAPACRWWGVDGPAGLDAYAWVARPPGLTALEADVRVRPGADPALGPVLLDLVRRAGREIDPTRPVRAFAHVDDPVAAARYADAGGKVVRHFWRMVIDLTDDPPPVHLPAGVVLRNVHTDVDKRLVHDIVRVSFRDHFGHDTEAESTYDEFLEHTHSGAGFDLALWWIAELRGVPAAAVVCRDFPNMGYIGTLGTLREHRGRGLGRTLLLNAFREFHARGQRRVGLGVDATNPTGAVALYESVGMRAENAWALYEIEPVLSEPSSGPSPAGSMMSDSKNV